MHFAAFRTISKLLNTAASNSLAPVDSWDEMWQDADAYGRIGMVLGAIVGVVTFLSIWIGTWFAGFVIGFVFGWIPAAFFAAIVFWLVRYLWGLAVLGAILLFLYTNQS